MGSNLIMTNKRQRMFTWTSPTMALMGRTAAGSTVGTGFPKLWKGMGWNFEIKCPGWRWECCREEILREEGMEALVHISLLHLEGTSATCVHHEDNRTPAVFLRWDLLFKPTYQAPVPNPASFFAFLSSWWRDTVLLKGDSVAPEMDEMSRFLKVLPPID